MKSRFKNDLLRNYALRYYLCISFTFIIVFFLPRYGAGEIKINIDKPGVQKLKIAITDFYNKSKAGEYPGLATKLPEVVSNDLDLSGYFEPLDKESFLEDGAGPENLEDIRFDNWSAIGAELLLKGTYDCVGRTVEVEARLFDVYTGRQILGKRILGEIEDHRYIMHRLGDAILKKLTGEPSIFLSKLAFEGNTTGYKEVYLCDFDGHNVQQITNDKSIALLPKLSPNGKQITYNSYKDNENVLYIQEINSGEVRPISKRPGINISGSFLSKGKRLALTLSQGDNEDIFIIDQKGKIKKRLTTHWAIDVSPSFSPNENKMAFVSNRSGSPQIYVKDLDSGEEERLTYEGETIQGFPFESTYNTSPSWSRRNRIVFESMTDGNFDIFTMDPDGGRLAKLTQNQGSNENPAWSPDGRYIVFSSNRKGKYHLYFMNANGQNQRRISFMQGDQRCPDWGP